MSNLCWVLIFKIKLQCGPVPKLRTKAWVLLSAIYSVMYNDWAEMQYSI